MQCIHAYIHKITRTPKMSRIQKRAGGKKIVLRKHCLLFIILTVRSTQDEAAAGAATALASATEVQSKTKKKCNIQKKTHGVSTDKELCIEQCCILY